MRYSSFSSRWLFSSIKITHFPRVCERRQTGVDTRTEFFFFFLLSADIILLSFGRIDLHPRNFSLLRKRNLAQEFPVEYLRGFSLTNSGNLAFVYPITSTMLYFTDHLAPGNQAGCKKLLQMQGKRKKRSKNLLTNR